MPTLLLRLAPHCWAASSVAIGSKKLETDLLPSDRLVGQAVAKARPYAATYKKKGHVTATRVHNVNSGSLASDARRLLPGFGSERVMGRRLFCDPRRRLGGISSLDTWAAFDGRSVPTIAERLPLTFAHSRFTLWHDSRLSDFVCFRTNS